MRRETRSHSSQQGDTEHDAPPSDGPEAADMVAELESNPAYAQFHFKRLYDEFLQMGASPLNALNDIDGPINLNAFALAQHSAAAAVFQGPSEIEEGSYGDGA